ncbi:MAG: hypothetical protein AB1Z51_02430 [Desulfuromonadales bacterium]
MKAGVLSLLLSLVFCLNGWAAELSADEWDKRIVLRGGLMAYDMSGDFSSTKDGRPEVAVDMDELGLDEDQKTYFLGAAFRIGERWRLRLDYFNYDDDANDETVNRTFEFDDLVVPVNGTVDSSLDIKLYVANLSYDLYSSERAKFGIGIGAHVIDFDLQIDGKASDGTDLGEVSEDYTVPIPNLFVGGLYALRNDLLFNYGAGWMSMSHGDYDGELIFARGALEYWPFEHVGLGAGYSYISADVDRDTGKKKENYDVEMPGPIFYLTVGF